MQIAIVLYPGFTALDVIGPYEVLRFLPGAEIRFVAAEVGPVVADTGVLLIAATHSLAETPSPDIVLIGGSGTASARTALNHDITAWLRQVHRTTTWTTSVCTGSVALAAAGILDGLPATSHWAEVPALAAFGAVPVGDRRVVHAGKVVTGAGVSAGIDLALWLLGEIAGSARARAAAAMIEYDPEPPYTAPSLADAGAATRRSMAALVGRELAYLARNEPAGLVKEMAAFGRIGWAGAIRAARNRGGRRDRADAGAAGRRAPEGAGAEGLGADDSAAASVLDGDARRPALHPGTNKESPPSHDGEDHRPGGCRAPLARRRPAHPPVRWLRQLQRRGLQRLQPAPAHRWRGLPRCRRRGRGRTTAGARRLRRLSDGGDSPRGAYFPSNPEQVDTWVLEGHDPRRVVGVRQGDGTYQVFVANGVDASAVVDRLTP